MSVCGRFAPSPTGPLHLGNARTALLAWRLARRQGGRFIMRIEDIDPQRSRPELIPEVLADLRWLGLDWDEGPDVGGPHAPYLQSERRERYREILDQWRAKGLVFACTCSRKDLMAAGAPHVGEEGPAYTGMCRSGSRRNDRAPAYRFQVAEGREITFMDACLGEQKQRVDRQSGDFVIWRADDWPSYQLAVVADDAAMGVTDVVRGADLISSTGRQILLFEALGAPVPRFHHVPMWLDEQGDRLAKRTGATSLGSLRAEGARPEAMVALMLRSLGRELKGDISAAEILDPAFDDLLGSQA